MKKPVLPEGVVEEDELARRLLITRRTLFNYRKKGILPYRKVGGRVYYRLADVDKLF